MCAVLSNTMPKCSFPANHVVAESANECNSCLCGNTTAKCTNLWCGLPNCIAEANATVALECQDNEVCVPALKETCLSPPCKKHGDCRTLEQSLRTAPPKYPTSDKCWPNQAIVSDNCSRINILLNLLKESRGLSSESFCHKIRTLLGGKMLEQKMFVQSTIIIICDIKTGTNDTIEVTMVSIDDDDGKE